MRVLADLLNRPTRTDGVFLAFVEGRNLPVLLAVDPLGISSITTRFAFFGGEEVALFSFNNMNGGLWFSSALAPQAVTGRGKPRATLVDASHYEIDTTLDGASLRGTTTVTFTPVTEGIVSFLLTCSRVCAFALLRPNAEVRRFLLPFFRKRCHRECSRQQTPRTWRSSFVSRSHGAQPSSSR